MRSCTVVLLLALLLSPVAAQQHTPIPQAFADRFGAKCLDSTPPSYSSLLQDPLRWVLFIEGGGWCLSPATCAEWAGSSLGSSAHAGGAAPGDAFYGGILSANATVNPRFHNYSLVFIHYCDGSSHTSNATLPLNVTGQPGGGSRLVWNRGRPNLAAQIAYQVETAGMGGALEVVLAGGSAGGFSAFLGLDFVRTLLPPAVRLVGAPDAGFFIDAPTYANASNHAFRDSFVAMDTIWNSTGSGGLNTQCLAAHAAGAGDLWRCFFPENAAPYIHTPWHAMMSAYDLAAKDLILQLGCAGVTCSAAQRQAMLSYRSDFLAALGPAVASFPGNGAYIDSCLVHEQSVDYCSTQAVPNCRGWNKYIVSSTTEGAYPPLTPQAGFALYYDWLMAHWDEVARARAEWGARVSASVAGGPGAHPLRRQGPPPALPGQVYIVDSTTWPDNLSCPWNGTGPPTV